MPDSIEWTAEAWERAVEALRSHHSLAELLALYDAGAISSREGLGAIFEYCQERPEGAAELVQILRLQLNEEHRNLANDLQQLLRKSPNE